MADFTVTINPCQVTDFEALGPTDASYLLKAGEKVLGSANGSQGACSYPVKYSLSVLKPFLTLDQITGELKVQTDDSS